MEPVITFAASAGVIDSEAGIIRGVSLITKGPALGHGVMIDDKTLEQVKAAAEQYSGGLKVKLNHSGGAGDIGDAGADGNDHSDNNAGPR